MNNWANEEKLTEEEVKLKYITPAIENAGWDKFKQIRMEYHFTDGRVIVQGHTTQRGKALRADYMLSYEKKLPLAIVEAKDNAHPLGAGMQQAMEYAQILDIPFAYASNGSAFIEHDFLTGAERQLPMTAFPTPEDLWKRYIGSKHYDKKQRKALTTAYHFNVGDYEPRYYQRIAINRTVEAVAGGQNRILLVMATGTGKTYTAFQIIHRLRAAGLKKKILYLADRNILIDQTMIGDFKPFKKVMTKVRHRQLDSSYEIYMALYHQLAGQEGNEPFREFTPDFFDLIIVDECHRGSAAETSEWRRILDYFTSATQIGMTATPKETRDVSNISYFGEPIYIYSLKQGINDGFLAPYKVLRVHLDRDLMGWRPEKGQRDDAGKEIPDEEYNQKDYDREIVLTQRNKLVAQRISDYLKENNRYAKTIVFCVDIAHAERMRQALINENQDIVRDNSDYVLRITGDDDYGKSQLENFIDPGSMYPTIVTTSKLLTTGVDCRTCEVIAIDSNIESMTEFKQIIGRGTRLAPDYGKDYFTILDFRGVSRKFADPEFDGEPVVDEDYPPKEKDKKGDQGNPDDQGGDGTDPITPLPPGGDDPDQSQKEVYFVSGVPVTIMREQVQYYDPDGGLITESLRDYTRKNIRAEYRTLDLFLQAWNAEERKEAIAQELLDRGVILKALREMVNNPELDDFDIICHIAYDRKPLTKSARAKHVRQRGYLEKYSGIARQVMEALLDKYAVDGISELERREVMQTPPLEQLGTPTEIVKAFGGLEQYTAAIRELSRQIYI